MQREPFSIEHVKVLFLFGTLSDSELVGLVSAIEITRCLEPEWGVIGDFAELLLRITQCELKTIFFN